MALRDDNINATLNINGSPARAEMMKLGEDTDKLRKRNRELELAMKKLEAQGKKDTEVYRLYSRELQQNERAITENSRRQRELSQSLQLTEKTMNELRREARQLRAHLANMIPDDPNRQHLNEQLEAINARMRELDGISQGVASRFKLTGAALAAFAAVKVAEKIKEWAAAVIDFTKEAIKMAGSAQGIQQAFNRFATSDSLKTLRTATQGMVNDMELMKAAVNAKNFNIPLEQMGKYLAFAQQRARDTGESVDYLVDSIVKGIGRKSPLILDNLGISASKLNEEVKKTGDFASAVGKIVEEEMGKTGKSVTTASDIATQKAVAVENLQLKWGQRFLKLSEGWDRFVTGFVDGMAKMVEPQKSQIEKHDEQIKKVADLEVNTAALATRYEELKSKTERTKDGQAELNRVMNVLRQTVPDCHRI
ncbi:MAG: hypothetical protein LBJ01_01595 [Tannerella sp.]|jgi:DNA repair exonuclease SbcCD ATPase subunit|nr:hypothetical protein [Tannerella sp.]